MKLSIILPLLFYFCSIHAVAQSVVDTVANVSSDPYMSDTIPEVVVSGVSPSMTKISQDVSKITFSTQNLGTQAKIMGTADVFRYMQLLPGVQTNTDYTAGISVQGCEFSQTIVDMDGATIFYPYHMLGIFSMCNSDHFPEVAIEKSIHHTDYPNRLGGKIEMSTYKEVPKRFSASADFGLISSGLSFSIPLSDKCALYLSGRVSYLDMLYSSLLENEDSKIDYNFFDTNLTFIYNPDSANSISVTALFGEDMLDIYNKKSFLDIGVNWGNFAVTASWQRTGKTSYKTTVALSDFRNEMDIIMPGFNIGLPFNISQLSVKEDVNVALNKRWSINAGGVFDYYRILDNYTDINKTQQHINQYYYAMEPRLYGEAVYCPNEQWRLSAGIRATYYHNAQGDFFSVDPSIVARWYLPHGNTLSLHAGIYHQYIHQAGYAQNGLPIDFWFMSDEKVKPQKAYSASIAWKGRIKPWGLDYTAEIYYKQMYNLPEFSGGVMDVVDIGYDARNSLFQSDGFNTGIDIMLQKQFGKLSGWLGYSLGFARRKIPGVSTEYVPSSRESLHNLSLSLSYNLNKSWNFASNFVFASGVPVTPVEALYVLNRNVVNVYGEYNSWNLPDYHRLDLSVTYTIPPKPGSLFRHSFNLSVVNVYAGKNVIYEYFTYEETEGTVRFKQMSTLFKMLPSLSYRIEFGK